MRKQFFLLALGAASLPAAAHADNTLYVAAYGGSFQTIMQSAVFPAFEKAHHVHIQYIAGNSSDTLAKLQAEKAHPDIDLAIMDDGPMYQALSLHFCAPLKPGPNYQNVYSIAKISPDAVGTGLVAVGIAYNADAFKKNGWAPPSSWADLADPKYKGRIAMPGLDNTYGLDALLMYAKMRGGGVDNIQPGFDYMAAKIAPNMDAFESSPGAMSQLFQSGEIVASIWGTSRTFSVAQTGFPLRFAYPKEGAPELMDTACVVNGAHDNKDAQALIEYLLSPDVQKIFALKSGTGPVNKTVKLTPTQAQNIPYGPNVMSTLVSFDWNRVNAARPAWQAQWNRQIEK
ncbi:ABC transporter substrate-binding protein [Acidocella facilis]|uniref:ABC transporter substrate-binding protein n=1 Tax=Acidocella facilis TaxID=525 RepID=UPI001F277E1D|nr:ABC transporter substrate-binding protein [Acidocella facilis]